MTLKRMLLTVLTFLLGLSAATAQTGPYPNQPIRIIVPFAPGGASDFVARVIQPKLSALLGQQIYIDNRAGAAGNIGTEVAARAPADGYSLFLGNRNGRAQSVCFQGSESEAPRGTCADFDPCRYAVVAGGERKISTEQCQGAGRICEAAAGHGEFRLTRLR